MDANTVRQLIESSLREADASVAVAVEGAGNHYDITVVSTLFEDQRPGKRQQTVYAALRQVIANSSVHAVNIRGLTPGEADRRDT